MNYLPTVIAGVVGILLGLIASKVLFVGQWYSLIVWGIAGLIIGYFGHNRNQRLISGAVFGALLGISFMFSGYQGSTPLLQNTGLLMFTLILAVVGAGCGGGVALVGSLVKKLLV